MIERLEVEAPGRWRFDAACRGHRMWYATYNAATRPIGKADRLMQVEGLALCRRCPVLEECEAWSLTEPDPAVDMVAGGFTPAQRRAIRLRSQR